LKPHTFKLFLFLSIIILTACESTTVKDDIEKKPISVATKPVTEIQLSLAEEAENFLSLAEDSDGPDEEHDLRLKAAYLYIEANDIDAAREQLAIISDNYQTAESTDEQAGEQINNKQNTDILLLTAKLAIIEKNTPLASQTIHEISPISRQQQIDYYALKSDLDYLYGRYYFTVDRRVQLSAYLSDEKSIHQNNTRIWAALSSMSRTQLDKQHSSNLIIKGWLDLARVMRSSQQNISSLENDLLDWGTRHPAHPANDSFLTELIDIYQGDMFDKKHIAVLLPMQGNLGKVSDTIKNGILSAYYNDSKSSIKPVINFYDSSDNDVSFRQLYQQAQDDGATNIIGPLDKVIINQLAQQHSLDIPVLTLNYAENSYSYTENLYQFGLSPEDEARQVAELAIAQGKLRAAIFYPDSDWGRRLNKAFTEHFEFFGGEILNTVDYATNTNDYRRPIRSLFNLDQSSIRRRKIENIIGGNVQSEPRRRQDIDMIFLAATHRSARSIMPAFKFHRAGDLTVYSTSHVYTGKVNRELDRDLNGLIFCDLPWILQKNSSPLTKVFSDNWPQQQNLTRLFAFGVDAYHLIYNLDYLEEKDYAMFNGLTGNIQLNEENRITRKLLWAKFKSGRAIYFEPELRPLPITANSQNTQSDAPTQH